MKKNYLFPLMALFMLLLAACSQDEVVNGANPEGPVTLRVGIPVNQPVTRAVPAIPEGFALRCIMQLVDASGSAISGQRYVQQVPAGSESVSFTFATPDDYAGAMFWADYVKPDGETNIENVPDHLYATADLTSVGYNAANIATLFNNDAADAFAGYLLNGTTAITLKRPFTKLTFKSTDEAYADYTHISVTELPAPTAYNVKTGATTGTASGIRSGELSIADGVWFSTYLFAGNTTANMGAGNNIKFTLEKEDGTSVNLLMAGENITLTENYNVTAVVAPSADDQTKVTVTFPGEMIDPSKPQPMAIGDYINRDGSYTKAYDADQAVAVVFALTGKTDNSNYGGRTVTGYAMALKGSYAEGETSKNLSGAPTTVETLDVSSLSGKTVTVDDALYADGYGIELWNDVVGVLDGELIQTRFPAWKALNEVVANVSEWYVPTPAMLADMAGMLYNDGWTLSPIAGVTTARFPAKDETFSAAYKAGSSEELAYQLTAKNALTSGITAEGKFASVQINVDGKVLRHIVPAKASNAIALRPVLTVFAAE